jgi:hypothetical protein
MRRLILYSSIKIRDCDDADICPVVFEEVAGSVLYQVLMVLSTDTVSVIRLSPSLLCG